MYVSLIIDYRHERRENVTPDGVKKCLKDVGTVGLSNHPARLAFKYGYSSMTVR